MVKTIRTSHSPTFDYNNINIYLIPKIKFILFKNNNNNKKMSILKILRLLTVDMSTSYCSILMSLPYNSAKGEAPILKSNSIYECLAVLVLLHETGSIGTFNF